MNFTQCYYTSIGGWNAVGSSELSQAAKQAFVSVQTTNAPKNQHPLDPSGKPIALFEIESDGKNVYAARCRYGFLDQRGRPNMFAHGYLSQWNKALVTDPAELCFIDDENYAGTKDDVKLEVQPKITMVRGFAAAMQAAGFAWNHFAVLTLAIYGSMERSEPLYIAAVQEGKALQALIYCIYLSMPFSIRQKLTFANAAIPGAKAKTVIFCKPEHLPGNALYFNLQNGETNVVTPDWIKKNKKNQFMSRFGVVGAEAVQKYFAALDAKLLQLGKQETVSYKVLNLADTLMQIDQGAALQIDDISLLYNMLTAPVSDEKLMDDYIAPVLERIVGQGVELTDEMLAMVMERLKRTENVPMLKIKAYFRRKQMMTMTIDEAANEMLDMKNHAKDGVLQSQEFTDALNFLAESEQGREVLSATVRKDYLLAEKKDYRKLADVYDDCTQLECDQKAVAAFIKQQAYELFCIDLTTVGAEAADAPFQSFIQKYLSPADAEAAKQMAKNRYWDLFDLTMFSLNARNEYQLMRDVAHPNCQKALNYWDIHVKAKQKTLDDVVRLYLAMIQKGDLSAKECNYLYEKCRSYVMATAAGSISDSSALIRLAEYGKKKNKTTLLTDLPALGMLPMQTDWLGILKNAPCFMEDGLISDAQVERFAKEIQAEVQGTASKSEKELAELILGAYQQILAEKKQIEKQAIKAQKDEQRQQRKEQAGAVFNKFSSLISKKNETVTEEEPNPVPDEEQLPRWNGEENDVIYSGRDLGSMTETSFANDSREEDPAQSKKGKIAQLFGKFKK